MKNLLLSTLILLFTTGIFAQSGTIRGFVYDKDSGEPIIFCNVSLKGTTMGASTDVNGYFSIAKVPAGDYKIIITYLGFDSLQENIHLAAGKILTKKFDLSESSIKLKEVTVSAERHEMKTEVKAAVIKITPKDLEMIPTIGGEPDLAQYLQIVPGVVFTGDQGGQLYIRGGSPVQNKVLLDGMIVYSPFHSIGLFSVFDTDIIRNIDVYTGGFNAEYGGRISSIMDIKTRDGNKKIFEGKLSANTFGSKLLMEGPLSKTGKSSFVFSGKTSYLNKSSELFYKHP
ncbi:MAG: TonB-dependent receptor, partial [Bacteroidota bacterium]|nr:TonB-dependent receptor [Bacteroidota bacterium]